VILKEASRDGCRLGVLVEAIVDHAIRQHDVHFVDQVELDTPIDTPTGPWQGQRTKGLRVHP